MKKSHTKRMMIVLLADILIFSSGCATAEIKEEPRTIAADEAVSDETEKMAEDEAAADHEDELASNEGQTFAGGIPWTDSNLKSNIKADDKLSPEDDFYLYANHDWLLATELKENESAFGPGFLSEEKTEEKARLLLEDDSLKSHDAELVQSLYYALMDWDARNEAGMKPVMKTVRDIQGIDNMEELSEFICDPVRSRFVPVFLSINNDISYDDSSRYITCIQLSPFTLIDAAEYADRTDVGDRYYEARAFLAKAMLTRAGFSETEAEQMFSDMISLEGKIAEKSLTSADKMSPDYMERSNNIYSPEEVAGLTSSYPLARMLKGRQYDDAERYLVLEPEAVRRIDELYDEENLDVIKAYMIIGYLNQMAYCLDRESYDAMVESYHIMDGSTGDPDYKNEAFEVVKANLSTPLSRLFLEKYDQTEKKERITKLCEESVEAYREMLKKEDWLSDETKNKAIEKLDAMRIHAVYPEEWEDYSSLSLKGLSLYDQVVEMGEYKRTLDRAKTNAAVNPEIWSNEFDILTSYAFYHPSQNAIIILLGILDEPNYDDDMSEEALLGGIGTMIAHEISHAFDTAGAQYDKDGNLRDWWTKEDYEAFHERADKLIAYYDGMTAWAGQKIPGENIQIEAIADMAGLKAMLKIAEEKDDFDYDAFFRAYAAFWRLLLTPEEAANCIIWDTHPPYYLRTNATLQQFDEFNQTYDIKEGDNMYLEPEVRVSVW